MLVSIVGIYSINLVVSGKSIRHESHLHNDFCNKHMCLLQLFFFEPNWTLLAVNLYMPSTPKFLPSMEHSISKFATTKASLLLILRDLVVDFGILSAETCTPISQYTHPWDYMAKLECLAVVFVAREWLLLWLPQSLSDSNPASLLSICN